MPTSRIDFQGELRPLLHAASVDGRVEYRADRRASIKDVIEALGVPHTEVGRIVSDGREVGFDHLLGSGEAFEVEPPVPPVDVTRPSLLRPEGLSELRFVVDVNVGKLAGLLRMLGFDAAFDPGLRDTDIADLAEGQGRVVLSRDRRLLQRRKIAWGRLVRACRPRDQLLEVAWFFGLKAPFRPFSRCLRCNVPLEPVDKAQVLHRLEPKTKKYFHDFHRCPACDRIYWAGSHHDQMAVWLRLLENRGR